MEGKQMKKANRRDRAVHIVLTTADVELLIRALANPNGYAKYNENCRKLSAELSASLELAKVHTS